MRRVPSVFIVSAAVALLSCSSSGNSGNETDAGAGGSSAPANGGASNGGASSGGASNGGASNGGASNGGASNGGASNGGASNGGASNGGGGSGVAGTPSMDGGSEPDSGAGDCPGRPDATNTGVPKGVSLTVVNGDVTVTKDGTIIDAEDIQGFVVVKASHVTIKRSIVRGGVATRNGDGISIQSGTGTVISDTEVALAHPSAFLDGIAGQDFTVIRANIHGGVDGMKLGSNSTVRCSYIHDMASFDSDPNQGGGPTHNDAIQILSGTGIHVLDNQLVASKDQNAAIQITQDFGAVGDVTIDGNFADGGGCTFNISHKGAASLGGITVTKNRFGRNSFYDCPILKSTKTTLVQSGNVWDDDGTAVPIQTHD